MRNVQEHEVAVSVMLNSYQTSHEILSLLGEMNGETLDLPENLIAYKNI